MCRTSLTTNTVQERKKFVMGYIHENFDTLFYPVVAR